MTGFEHWFVDVVDSHAVSWIIPADEVPGVNWHYMAVCVLSCCVYVYRVVNVFVFLGNWDILTLLVIADIVFFMVVTLCRLNVMYRVMFLLVMDLVVCIYVIYL